MESSSESFFILLGFKSLEIDHLAALFDGVAEREVDAQDPDDCLFELIIGIFNKLEGLSQFVASVEDATGKN